MIEGKIDNPLKISDYLILLNLKVNIYWRVRYPILAQLRVNVPVLFNQI